MAAIGYKLLVGLFRLLTLAGAVAAAQAASAADPPGGFVRLRDVEPSIAQDMRYATANNFTGKPVPGYGAAECILKREAAEALKRAQKEAQAKGLSLKVYDCYRPARAVRAFMDWARAPEDGRTKSFYPHLPKSALTPEYIAPQSAHSTGTAVDLTLIHPGEPPRGPAAGAACDASASSREPGDGLDMGTSFDCFDPKANTESRLAAPEQKQARALLKSIMERAGFAGYAAEWWHFSLAGAKGQRRYDFPIE
jgi:D-alanyl-D-alanine dipeptidase